MQALDSSLKSFAYKNTQPENFHQIDKQLLAQMNAFWTLARYRMPETASRFTPRGR